MRRLKSQIFQLAGEIEKLEEKSDPTPCVYVLYKERSDAEAVRFRLQHNYQMRLSYARFTLIQALSSIAKSGEFGPINIKWGTTVESGMKEEDSGLSARAILASLGDDGV